MSQMEIDIPETPEKQISEENEVYSKYKSLQKELELLNIQENYIKDETMNLKVQYSRAK